MNPTKSSVADLQVRTAAVEGEALLTDLRGLIERSRRVAVAAVNSGLTLMYWRISARIRHEVLGGERARYGAEIVVTLSRQLAPYLRWLARHDQEPGDAPPLGIILCTGKKQEQIELLELGKSGIHVAEYLTVLPPREVFQQKIHDAMAQARFRLASRTADPA